ncbi:hypothetical protein BT69DRAFT_867957 [Atractiella rhizophila]|nr:hypothetical protein BT69DRAFT_867957 [Atractiella rhizophila]
MVSVVRHVREERKLRRKMTWLWRMAKAYEAIESAVSSQKMKALVHVHVITPSRSPKSIHLSILPSFLSRLPLSAHTLRISLRSFDQDWRSRVMPTKLSHLSLERFENVVDKDGAINLHVIIHNGNVFLNIERQRSAVKRAIIRALDDSRGDQYCYSCTFPRVRENAIFAHIASYSENKERFVPVSGDDSSSFPPLDTASIIQLSFPPPHVTSCSISSLPVELLSLIFSFFDDVSAVSDVCKLWKTIAVPYWREPGSVEEKYELLKRYPGAGRLWNNLWFNEGMDVGIAKELIVGSPNVMTVRMDAFWDEEEVKIVLNAIEGLKRVDRVRFGGWGSRKWSKVEIEDFMRRMGDRIRRLTVYDVEDSPASASAGLHLSSHLEYLDLYKYLPLPSLSESLPRTLKYLKLSNMCPLPSSIFNYPLPPLLEELRVLLAPFSADGKTSILPTPLDLSHLTHLTHLRLDGGEETSNLVSRHFFSTLKNATVIRTIRLEYCMVDSSDCPDFIRWFFGDWRRRGAEKGDRVDGRVIGWHLEVHLFFGEWSEEDITSARTMMEKSTRSKRSGFWVLQEGEE